jgi:D-sedoheptulose 7-phosphate isomerase
MIQELITRYPVLSVCRNDIQAAIDTMIRCYEHGGKVLLCGNGGSCADSDHIVGELMKGFLKKRPLSNAQKAAMKARSATLNDSLLNALQCGLPAISLPSLTALNTAFCNDADPELIYAQAVLALAKPGDVLIAISTSGNAKNVFAAVQVAKGLGVTVIGLTGNTGGKLKQYADIAVCVPETETFKIQELHLPVYHTVCAAVEAHFFPV